MLDGWNSFSGANTAVLGPTQVWFLFDNYFFFDIYFFFSFLFEIYFTLRSVSQLYTRSREGKLILLGEYCSLGGSYDECSGIIYKLQ